MSRVGKFSLKLFLPRTLFARSLLILITPVILIQMITTFVFLDRHWSKVTTRLAYAVAGEVSMLADFLEGASDPDDVHNLVRFAEGSLSLDVEYDFDAVLGEEQGVHSALVWEWMVAKTLSRELRQSLGRPFVLDMDFSRKWVQVKVQLDDGVLRVSLPQRRLFSSSSYVFLLWMVGTSLVLLIIAILFMRNQIRPIKKLAVAAERFGRGRDVAMFKPQGSTEVRMAGEAFLGMHKRIRRQIEQRTTMLAGVSHDLRTPLTRMKLQLAMLGDSSDVVAMKGDIQEMEKMIEGYLDFVRGDGDEQVSLIYLNDLLGKVEDSAKRQNIDVSVRIGDDVSVMGRPMAIERCLMNLVNNAGKYAGHVWVEARIDDEKGLVIVIEDDGPGILEEHYEEVFRPFYRVDTSRSLETGGVGLGLPIAMDIVHSHGGKIWLDKGQFGGLRVFITLPL